jgi:hypothetical protein
MTVSVDGQRGQISSHAGLQALRLELLQDIAASIGTDLSDIFSVISGALQLQQLQLTPAQQPLPWLETAIDMATEGAGVAQSLLQIAGPHAARDAVVDIRALLGLDISVAPGPVIDNSMPVLAYCDHDNIRSLLTVISGCARVGDAGTATGLFSVQACLVTAVLSGHTQTRDYLKLTITQPRYRPSLVQLEHMLMPPLLIRGKKAGAAGTAVNFAAHYASIRRSGGDLTVQLADCGGLEVSLLLPRAKWLTPDWYTGAHPGRQRGLAHNSH